MTPKRQPPHPSHSCRAERQRFGDHDINPGLAGTGLNCMALSCHTPVPTPAGWVTLKDIAPGQAVFDQRGQPCTVVAVCQRGPEIVHQVEFDDESILLAGAHHPWVTVRHHLRHRIHIGRFALGDWASSFDTRTTEEIRDSLVYRSGTLVESMHSVPVARPLRLPDADLPIDPYILGLWLGDGTSTAPTITCHRDDEHYYRERAIAAGEKWRILSDRNGVLNCSLARGSEPIFLHRLRGLGLLGNKHVPPIYLRASDHQRVELLRGLMDSDGYFELERRPAEFTSTSELLAKGTHELSLSLGQKATMREGDAVLDRRWISEKWRVCFTPSRVLASLPRKAARAARLLERRQHVILPRTVQRYIRSVVPVTEHPTTCLLVDSPCRMLLVGESMIPVRTSGLPGLALRL